MNTKKVFYLMLGLLVVASGLAIGSLVVGTSMLKQKSAELTNLKLEDQVIEQQQVALVQAKSDLEKYQELNTIAQTIVPRDKDQAKTVREIILLAEESGITINEISFPNSTLGTQAPAPARTPDSDNQNSTTTPKQQTPAISQVLPVEGIPGLYQLEVTVVADEVALTYNQLISFLEKLEQNRRTAQVTSINISPNDRSLGFDLTMNVFVKP